MPSESEHEAHSGGRLEQPTRNRLNLMRHPPTDQFEVSLGQAEAGCSIYKECLEAKLWHDLDLFT